MENIYSRITSKRSHCAVSRMLTHMNKHGRIRAYTDASGKRVGVTYVLNYHIHHAIKFVSSHVSTHLGGLLPFNAVVIKQLRKQVHQLLGRYLATFIGIEGVKHISDLFSCEAHDETLKVMTRNLTVLIYIYIYMCICVCVCVCVWPVLS